MILRLLSLLCVPLLFTGCNGVYTYHYVYHNGTDKPIEVMAYYVSDNQDAVEMQCHFVLVPDGEYTITGSGVPRDPFFPFERARYVQLSNDEQAVVFATAGDVNGVRYNIFRLDCYEERSRMHTVWLTYTFTEADFRDGVPVTEESDTDY